MIEMKDSGVEWVGEIPINWKMVPVKRYFRNNKKVVGDAVDNYERLSLTMNGVLKRSKDDSDGLQPEKFEGYQILGKNELVFKLIDLENVKTSRVGLSPYTGLVSPAYIVLSNDSSDNRFFYYWFMSMYYNEVFNHLGGDGVRSALNAKDVLTLPIPFVKDEIRCHIADYLDSKCSKIDAIIEREQAVIEKLKEYKLSVITEAVTKGLDPNIEMKDSGYEFIGEIPVNVFVTKASHLYEIVLGRMLNPNKKSDDETLESYFCAANVHFDGVDTSDLKQMWFSSNDKKNYLVKTGDLLIVEGGAGAGGAAIIDKIERDFYIQNSIMIARTKENISVDVKWLFYTLYSLVNRKYIDFVCNKATIPHFTKEKLSNTPIVVMKDDNMKAIIQRLDNLSEKVNKSISNKQSVIAKLTEYKKSLIYEVVTGKKEV